MTRETYLQVQNDGFALADEICSRLEASQITYDILSGAQDEAHEKAQVQLNNTEQQILKACLIGPRSSNDLLQALGYKSRTGNYKKAMNHLLDVLELIEKTLPDATQSKHPRYIIMDRGRNIMEKQS
jgi:hypothetical protein